MELNNNWTNVNATASAKYQPTCFTHGQNDVSIHS
jgi:hypothetical protein